MERVRVLFRDCPCDIDGYTVEKLDDDGQPYYTIILNARLSDERQRAAFYHEMLHINSDDFSRAKKTDVGNIEEKRSEENYFIGCVLGQ